jgi:Fe-S cluster biogenesis protein NfuA
VPSRDSAGRSPLANRLFGVDGVRGVFLGSDFITVTKDGEADWHAMKPAVLGAMMEHFTSGEAAISNSDVAAEAEPEDDEVTAQIKELIDTRVRPAVAQDGGDITFQGYREGIVYLHMRGACSGCPSSTATLRHGIENLLRHFIPEVQEVRPV